MKKVKSQVPDRKLTSDQVYEIVLGEITYAKKWDVNRSKFPETHADKDKSLETWLLWMEDYIAEARHAATGAYDKTKALDLLRQALSLGFNAAMYHGMPKR